MRFPIAIILIALISLTGCSDSNHEPYQPRPVQPSAPKDQAPPAVKLPQGSIPDKLIGAWNGGQGTNNSSEWLQFGNDGKYQRSSSGTVFEQGVAVMSGDSMAMYLTSGHQRTARVSYVASAGIETLSLTFSDGGTYTYAKA